MDLFRNAFSRLSNAPSPDIQPCRTRPSPDIQPCSTRPSPINIPEILERIFYFTDNCTLCRTVVLVCRQWFYINANRLPRTVYYKNDMWWGQPGLMVSRLTGATQLRCYLTVEDVTKDLRDLFRSNIRNVIVNSQEEYRKQSEKRSQTATHKYNHKHKPSIYSFSPLRDMTIDVARNFDRPFDTFPFPETLTSVTLRLHSTSTASFNFGKILRQCPLLETLSIEMLMGDWNRFTRDEPMKLHKDLALRSLILSHTTLCQTSLEHILSFSPKLKVLKLIGMIASDPNFTLLLQHIRKLPLDLKTLHFSVYDRRLPRQLQQQIFELCPISSEWDLWASDMTPLLMKELETRIPCLTTLELHWQLKGSFTKFERFPLDIIKASRLLFEYLCNSPSVANLRVLKTGVLHCNMDVYGRQQFSEPDSVAYNSSDSPQAPWTSPGVWRCRNLRILHISLRDHTSSMTRRAHSRIVFGYITRVAPQLEELEIFYPYTRVNKAPYHIYAPNHCMQLEGGFCLLGRLRYLQRLRVYSAGGSIVGSCQEMDLNWIVPSGRNDKFKEMRRQEVASWQSLRLGEDLLLQAEGDVSGDGTSLDAELWGPFRNLGLLKDVEETVNEIDTGSLVPFPFLVDLSFQNPIPQRPEKVLDNLFPKPSFGFW